jgi:hypothetical protein
MRESIRELLYRSFDAELTEEERVLLERALSESPELCAERNQISALREALSRTAAASFSLGFAERVLERLPSPEPRRSDAELVMLSMRRMFRWVAAVGVPACVILLVWNLRTRTPERADSADILWETPVEMMLENGQ